jgi:hypothetical protein
MGQFSKGKLDFYFQFLIFFIVSVYKNFKIFFQNFSEARAQCDILQAMCQKMESLYTGQVYPKLVPSDAELVDFCAAPALARHNTNFGASPDLFSVIYCIGKKQFS